MSYWVVENRDDAIMGFVSGVKSQDTVDGPFNSFEEASLAKAGKSFYGGPYFYTVVHSCNRPKSGRSTYEFIDADWEFNDI